MKNIIEKLLVRSDGSEILPGGSLDPASISRGSERLGVRNDPELFLLATPWYLVKNISRDVIKVARWVGKNWRGV